MMRLLLALVAALAANSVFALPQVNGVSGALTQGEVEQSLKPLAAWFERAEKLCKERTASDCRIKLRIQVNKEGDKPRCDVTYSGITDGYSRYVYCAVAITARFSAKDQGSSFFLLFNVDAKGEKLTLEPAAPPDTSGQNPN